MINVVYCSVVLKMKFYFLYKIIRTIDSFYIINIAFWKLLFNVKIVQNYFKCLF
jgi:hypothetical protein